jgi:hypothetical protein
MTRLQPILFVVTLMTWSASAYGGNGIYFHVDDFSGLPAPYGALDGNHSLWCGARASAAFADDGYGNSWDETFESCAFDVTGDVTFSYEVRWDLEPDYDVAYVEYLDAGNAWVPLTVASVWGDRYNGSGSASEVHVIPSAQLGPTVRLRFRVATDGAWSDEDGLFLSSGAIVVDNVTMRFGMNVVNFEDFECESQGAQITLSGKWAAGTHATCEPYVPCGSVPTEEKTWGAVKALYGD